MDGHIDERRPARAEAPASKPVPGFWTAVWRGARNRCPICDTPGVFDGWLKPCDACAGCGAPIGEMRADDAPPYFVIFAVGHIVVPLLMWVDRAYEPSVWTLSAIFLPLTAILALLLIRPAKGATIGILLRIAASRARDAG